jgi:hypothetical protein
MYKPVFPYLDNQAIVSSGRVVIHSSDDFIFHFGKKGVAISSPATFTVDASEKTIINSKRIELGNKADQSVLRGDETVKQLGFLLDQLNLLAETLSNIKRTKIGATITVLNTIGVTLQDTTTRVKASLNSECLSKTTYTL